MLFNLFLVVLETVLEKYLKNMRLSVIFYVFVILNFTELVWSRRRYYGRMVEFDDQWIEQKLDHFDPQNTRTWKMRYLQNTLNQAPGGPIFIYIGGEWKISDDKVSDGLLYDMAREFNGSVYYTEHRYYGKSRPTENSSTENLKFLSIEQALEDLAQFIRFLKSSNPKLKDSKVLVAGGSYPGGMAVWMRQKYPELVDAAWASSAIIVTNVDFKEFKQGMTEAIKTIGGEACVNSYSESFKEVERMIDIGNYTYSKEAFGLCSDIKNQQDISLFMYQLSECVAYIIQFDNGYRISESCESFLEDGEKVDILANMCGGSWDCLENNYENYVKKYQDTDWESEMNKQMRQWTYQTCTQLGWFQTSTSDQQIFGTKYPVDFFIQLCTDIFGEQFNAETISKGIHETNLKYGGLDPKVTRVYFTQGALDPWRRVGIQENYNKDSPATVIPGASHMADFDSISKHDSKEMRESKEKIRQLVIDWFSL